MGGKPYSSVTRHVIMTAPTSSEMTTNTPANGADWLALSDEASTLKRSVIRDLLKVIVAPDIISLAGGLPANELLPVATFRQCIDEVLQRDGAKALQYGPAYAPLQEWIAGYMRSRSVACEPEQVFITNGAQQGLSILSRLLLDPGAPAVVEEITFTGIGQVTKGRGAAIRTVPTDLRSGVDVDALERAFARSPKPRLAVLIPDFHNPLGVSLTLEKRQQVTELAARYGVPVIEDDPYSLLRFAGDMLPPIKAFDEAGFVFYLGSFSKILAPATRLGWIVVPPDLLTKITVMRESMDLESSALMQRAVAQFLTAGHLDAHLTRFNAANHLRRDALLQALDRHLGDVATWTEPEGGLFVWLTLPQKIDTWEMLDAAVVQKIAYVPGGAFATAGGYANTMRLNFCSVHPDVIPDAVATLAAVIRSRL